MLHDLHDLVAVCVLTGGGLMVCFGVEALLRDQEMIAASKWGQAATCIVAGVGAVKGGVFELRYHLDEVHCNSIMWQNVPYGPFTPEAHPVGSKITCYGWPLRCDTQLVVYKVDELSSYALGMTIGGVLLIIASVAAMLCSRYRISCCPQRRARTSAASAAQASLRDSMPPPPSYTAAISEEMSSAPLVGDGKAALY